MKKHITLRIDPVIHARLADMATVRSRIEGRTVTATEVLREALASFARGGAKEAERQGFRYVETKIEPPPPSAPGRAEALRKLAVELRAEGMAQTKIAETLGVSQAYISRLIRGDRTRKKWP